MFSEKRKDLLIKLESIVFRDYYSNYTKHYDKPDLVFSDGTRISRSINDRIAKIGEMKEYDFFKIRYNFGPNQFPIMDVLDDVLQFFEKEYGLVIESNKLKE